MNDPATLQLVVVFASFVILVLSIAFARASWELEGWKRIARTFQDELRAEKALREAGDLLRKAGNL